MPANPAPPQDFRYLFGTLAAVWKDAHRSHACIVEAGKLLEAVPAELVPPDLAALQRLAEDTAAMFRRAVERARTAAAVEGR